MPKKKHNETAEEQSARFKAEAQKLIEDGKLNPTDAEKALDKLINANVQKHPKPPEESR